MKQRKQVTKTARAIDPRSLAAATGGANTPIPWKSVTQPQPWIVVGTGPQLQPEPSPW